MVSAVRRAALVVVGATHEIATLGADKLTAAFPQALAAYRAVKHGLLTRGLGFAA